MTIQQTTHDFLLAFYMYTDDKFSDLICILLKGKLHQNFNTAFDVQKLE